MNVKHNHRLMQSSLFVVLLVCFALSVSAIQAPPAAVVSAAEAGLTNLVPRLNGGASFEAASSGKVELGFGFQIHTIEPTEFTGEPGRPMWEMVSPIGIWRFVVTIDGIPAGLMTVAQVDGQWQAVGIGAKTLAQEVETVRRAWPQADGYEYRFIRVFQAEADFMEVKKGLEQPGYAPMISARVSLQIQSLENGPNRRLFQSEIIEPLRDIVMQTLEQDAKLNNRHNTER